MMYDIIIRQIIKTTIATSIMFHMPLPSDNLKNGCISKAKAPNTKDLPSSWAL